MFPWNPGTPGRTFVDCGGSPLLGSGPLSEAVVFGCAPTRLADTAGAASAAENDAWTSAVVSVDGIAGEKTRLDFFFRCVRLGVRVALVVSAAGAAGGAITCDAVDNNLEFFFCLTIVNLIRFGEEGNSHD